jgi:hypothetical protein
MELEPPACGDNGVSRHCTWVPQNFGVHHVHTSSRAKHSISEDKDEPISGGAFRDFPAHNGQCEERDQRSRQELCDWIRRSNMVSVQAAGRWVNQTRRIGFFYGIGKSRHGISSEARER